MADGCFSPLVTLITLSEHWLPCKAAFFFFWLCHAACGILVPRPGIKPVSPALGAWSLNHWTAREVPKAAIFIHCGLLPERISGFPDVCLSTGNCSICFLKDVGSEGSWNSAVTLVGLRSKKKHRWCWALFKLWLLQLALIREMTFSFLLLFFLYFCPGMSSKEIYGNFKFQNVLFLLLINYLMWFQAPL